MKIIKTKENYYKIKVFRLIFLKIRDVHPGYGAEIIADLLFITFEEAQNMIEFLKTKKICVIKPIDWKELKDCKIKYFYKQ